MDIEREAIRQAKQWETSRRCLEERTAERDEAIRQARAAGISQKRVMEIFGLSRPRINQITRRARA